MLLYFIVGALLLGSALCKAVQDSIAHHNSLKRLGQWWDHERSWMWKYARDKTGIIPNHLPPRFFGATTFLVFVTDAWHLFGMFCMSFWQAALCLLLPFPWRYQLLSFAAIKLVYGSVFELLYRYLNKQA